MVRVYKKDKFNRVIGYGINWWFNPNFIDSFSIFDLNSLYKEDYFENDHVNKTVVKNYVDYSLQYGQELLGRKVETVLELGCAGGWFTEEFIRRKIDIFAIEGSKIGYEKTKERVGRKYIKNVMRHDLRLPMDLHRQFDIALCTEVAEHIEPPFSSQLVSTLVKHSKIIWFSFEKPLTNEQTYDHCNEQPEKFWRNLFNFYEFNMLKLPKHIVEAVESRGGYIFCHKSIEIPKTMSQYIVRNQKYRDDARRENISSKINIRLYLSRTLLKVSDKLSRWADRVLYSS